MVSSREQLVNQIIDRTLLGGAGALPDEVPGLNPGYAEAEQLEVMANSTALLQRLRPLAGVGAFVGGFLLTFGAVAALRK